MILFSAFLFAVAFAKSEHHEHGAHVHGRGELSVAFDGAKGTIEFRAPGESVVGFEHEAKSAKDKARVAEAFGKLEKRAGEVVKFEASLKCVVTKDKIEAQKDDDGPYATIVASYAVTCEKSPKGSKVTFAPATVFPKLKDVDVTLLIDDLQKSAEAGPKGVDVQL